ncbi:MAG: ABC transporter permease [Thermoguttaceae bacterium]|nr:ABC transporter permease [Thermoguttaceae bacterium]
MRQLLNGFNALYVKELKRSLAVSGIFALLIAAFVYASVARFWVPLSSSPDVVLNEYRAFWPWLAPIFVFLSSTAAPIYVFASERKEGGFKVLQRFPVATATVYLAKFAAIFTALVAICVFFAVSSFAFDLYYGDALSTTLRAPLANVGFLISVGATLLFASLELFCWSVFWANRVRPTFAFLATGASAFVGWALTGVVIGITALTLKPELAAKLPHAPILFAAFFTMLYGFHAASALSWFGLVRLAFLAIPLRGIYRQCRRQGTATAFNLPS